MTLTVGIDIATAGIRVLARDGDGTVVAATARELSPPVRDESGRSEQDATGWWPTLAAALRELTTTLARDSAAITAVTIAATSGTIVAVDRTGEPVSPALMYDDRRAAEVNARAVELGAARWSDLGITVSPTAALGRIAWLHENTPHAAGFAHTPDLLGARLVGTRVATDSSHSLKSGYDPLHRQWPTEVFDALGVPAHWLPEVRRPTTVLGVVCPDAARETGLPPGCHVVAGMTDGCAAQLASGAVRPGQFVGILGTTYVLKGVTETLLTDPSGAAYSHRHPDGWWLLGGASNTGGEALAGAQDLAALDDAASARGPAGLVTYPLRRQGERFPFVRARAHGLRTAEPSDAVELHRARLEGVAFLERLALDYVRMLGATIESPLFTAGAASKSSVWNRIRATVTGQALRVAPHAETAYGAAQLAAAAELPGGLSDVARRASTSASVVEPEPAEAAALTESYRRFCTELGARGWIDERLLGFVLG